MNKYQRAKSKRIKSLVRRSKYTHGMMPLTYKQAKHVERVVDRTLARIRNWQLRRSRNE